jgi:NTE family protein
MIKITNLLRKKPKIALVLGGGGARGIAHLGVLKFLEENGYDFDFIVGTSAGAVFGALYLKTLDIKTTIDEYLTIMEEDKNKSDVFKIDNEDKSSLLSNLKEKYYTAKALFKKGIFESTNVENSYKKLFENCDFQDLKKKIYIVSTDLISGQDIVFSKGALLPALMATSALPGVFPPVEYKGFYLIDGGPTQKLPSLIAKALGADKIFAIDVGSKFKRILNHPEGVKIILRSEEIVSYRLHKLNRNFADILLEPDVKKYKWYDFNNFNQLFDAGYKEAELKRDDIKRFFLNYKKASKNSFEPIKDFIII